MRRIAIAVFACLLSTVAFALPASANTSHFGWPAINGILLMNKNDSGRQLDARPGFEPFAGKDASYSCDTVHKKGRCHHFFILCQLMPGANCPTGGRVVSGRRVHNELLGGHGSDTIYGGPFGDVIWGDYKPSHQPTKQHDVLFGGVGNDYIYGSHGFNHIESGAGDDHIFVHYGHGTVDCGGGQDVVRVARVRTHAWKFVNCETISHKTLGY